MRLMVTMRGFFTAVLLALIINIPSSWCCPHERINLVVIEEATCAKGGRVGLVCEECDAMLDDHRIYLANHSFGEYKITKYARGDKSGVETRTCSVCQKTEDRAYDCPHKMTYAAQDFAPSCTETGLESTVCRQCRGVLDVRTVEAAGHVFGEYMLTALPTANKNGVESRSCAVCGEKEEREYICPHENMNASVVKEASCLQEGERVIACDLCGKVVDRQTIDKVGCRYGSWVYAKKATPVNAGERYRECSCCGNKETESYTFSMAGKNSIYIPGTGIDHKITFGSFSQSAVDSYNIVYTTDNGSSDPFVLGHKYGAMGNLHKTDVGQYLYISVNGSIETYLVVVSEYGLQNESWTDIIGQSTGYSIWDCVGSKTLHMYTCYGRDRNGRWMVLAKEVS